MRDDAYFEERRRTLENILTTLAEMHYAFRRFDCLPHDLYLKYEPQSVLSSRCLLSQYAYTEEDCIYYMEDTAAQCLYLIFLGPHNELCAYPPMLLDYSPERFAAAIEELRKIFTRLQQPLLFEHATQEDTLRFQAYSAQCVISAPPSQMDYIYEFESFRDFTGGHNANRRRKYNYFTRRHQVVLEEVCDENRAACEAVLCAWCNIHTCDECSYRCPKNTSIRALPHLKELNAFGYLIRVDDASQAVILLGRMSPEMLDVLAVCSISREMGMEETMYALVAEKVSSTYPYMNLEEDMGIERLRLHKKALRPCRLQPKYTVLL